MSSRSTVITIPKVELSLTELLAVIRRLDDPTRAEIAKVLLETRMDSQLSALVRQLAETPPSDGMSDVDIEAEVKAVRHSSG